MIRRPPNSPPSPYPPPGRSVETAATALSFTITHAPDHGTLKQAGTPLADGDTFLDSRNDVTYQPAAYYNGSDNFKFKVTDTGDPVGCSGGPPACSAALDSAVQTVSITVNPVTAHPPPSPSPPIFS